MPMTTAQDVCRFLEKQPDFFVDHPELLEVLHVPHRTDGQTVSLVERQVKVLRANQAETRQRLATLIRNARDNEALVGHTHRLALRLIAAEIAAPAGAPTALEQLAPRGTVALGHAALAAIEHMKECRVALGLMARAFDFHDVRAGFGQIQRRGAARKACGEVDDFQTGQQRRPRVLRPLRTVGLNGAHASTSCTTGRTILLRKTPMPSTSSSTTSSGFR
jgi:uncharacterized protein YigA (DUF484 family)